MTLLDKIAELANTESQLTIDVMCMTAIRLNLTDPNLINKLYDTVIFYTGNWPEDQGWGTSDTNAVIHSYQQ